MILRKRKRERKILERNTQFFFKATIIYVHVLCKMTIFWVVTIEPIFPCIPAVCCGVSPVYYPIIFFIQYLDTLSFLKIIKGKKKKKNQNLAMILYDAEGVSTPCIHHSIFVLLSKMYKLFLFYV